MAMVVFFLALVMIAAMIFPAVRAMIPTLISTLLSMGITALVVVLLFAVLKLFSIASDMRLIREILETQEKGAVVHQPSNVSARR